MIVSMHLAVFTNWLKEVRKGGTRVLAIRDSADMLDQLMAPKGLKEAVVHAADRLRKAKQMRVVSDAGTDFTVRLGEYPVMMQYGYADEPGRFDHWGAGHVHTFPNEGSANGVVMAQPGDCVILPYVRYVQDPMRITIRDGFISKIEGGLDAKLMHDWLEDNRRSPDDNDGHAISHLGWGLNPQARWDNIAMRGDEPEEHRAAIRTFPGNFLFSTGPNTEGGGKRTTRGHYDLPMRDCTILLDGEPVIERGKLVDPKMVVQREGR
jgi:2,5-dihydroxypyridine 5,6-dioxygenase